jgi:hypothetical protein
MHYDNINFDCSFNIEGSLMYSNRLAESSTSTTFRNFRIDNDHADGHNGGNPAKPGDREIFIGKRDTSLPSNRI